MVISIHAVMKTATVRGTTHFASELISIHAVMKTATAIYGENSLKRAHFLMSIARLYVFFGKIEYNRIYFLINLSFNDILVVRIS
jgi:hypothetical protein